MTLLFLTVDLAFSKAVNFLEFKISGKKKQRLYITTEIPKKSQYQNPLLYKQIINDIVKKNNLYQKILSFKSNLNKLTIVGVGSDLKEIGNILTSNETVGRSMQECVHNLAKNNNNKFQSLESLILLCVCTPDLSIINHALLSKKGGQELIMMEGCFLSNMSADLAQRPCNTLKSLQLQEEKLVGKMPGNAV